VAPSPVIGLSGQGFEALSLSLALARLGLPQHWEGGPGASAPPASGLLPSNAVHALFALGLGPWLKRSALALTHWQPPGAEALPLQSPGGSWRHGAPWYAVDPQALYRALVDAWLAEGVETAPLGPDDPRLSLDAAGVEPLSLAWGEGLASSTAGPATARFFRHAEGLITRLPLPEGRVRWEAPGTLAPDAITAALAAEGYEEEASDLTWHQATLSAGAARDGGALLGPGLHDLPLWGGQRLAMALEDAWTAARFFDARPPAVALAGIAHHRSPRYARAEAQLERLSAPPPATLAKKTRARARRLLARLAPEWAQGQDDDLYRYDVRRRFGEGV
jgi:hypothetical protein